MSFDLNIQQHDPSGCLFLDKPKPSPFYESTNLIMTTKPADPNNVYLGSNTTQVTATWSGSCSIPGGDSVSVMLDIYIGDPTMPMIPGSTLFALTPPLNSIAISEGGPPVTYTTPVWDSSKIPHLSQPHHACILARVYPDTATPDSGDLTAYPPDDFHYTQHNVYVATADGQGLMRIGINNGTVRREPLMVSIHAVPNLKPSPATLAIVLPSLKLIPTFKQISTTPLRHVEFDLGPFKGHQHESLLDRIEDWIEREVHQLIRELERKARTAGGASAQAVLPPGLIAKFNFVADFSGSKPGDAYLYDVTQITGTGQPYGGLLIAIVAA
ncbi:MAG: hypothetical protein LAQ69_20845 [Acidobacteriia bacterium]|nr:hypothetical protein [Terriglobia bacterium]